MSILDNHNLKIIDMINKYSNIILDNPNIIGIGRGKKIINGRMLDKPSLTISVRKK